MPDHLHLLTQGIADTANLPRFIKAWKQATAWQFKRDAGRRLWQTGYFEHVLRTDESIERHARYIVANPVRAGLAKSVDEYPFARILEMPR